MPHHVVILGAGISGLSCAWDLKRRYGSEITVTILEKTSRIGGWIDTNQAEDFLFEQGPRSFRSKGGLDTLHLIEELGLQKEVVIADSSAHHRYIYSKQRLQRLPYNLPSLLTSPWLKELGKAAWRDWKMQPQLNRNDESVYDFFVRRLTPHMTEQLIDPFISGIYAGDMRKLSMRACFPSLYEMEQKSGSLIKGMFKKRRVDLANQSSFIQNMSKISIFSFRNGMYTLVQELGRKLEADIRLEVAPTAMRLDRDHIHLELSDQSTLTADYVISTLPAYSIGNLLQTQVPELSPLLMQIPYATVAVVNLGYKQDVLQRKGFGYLVPHGEQEQILGCVWDSCVFPQQNHYSKETRLTLMMGGIKQQEMTFLSEKEYTNCALQKVEKHLGIKQAPDICRVKLAKQAIPQYEIGYTILNKAIQDCVAKFSSRLLLKGTAFEGVSLNSCIQRSRCVDIPALIKSSSKIKSSQGKVPLLL